MRTQWELLIFLFCLNLAIGLVAALQLPGTDFVNPANNSASDADQYEEHFNSTDIMGWQSTPFSGIPIIGDLFSGFEFLVRNVRYLIDGFPSLLTYLKDSYIVDADGRLAFDIIANVLRAIYALLVSVFLIEFLSGRIIHD